MITASSPASSANLGPGYDVLAVALDLRCRVAVAEASRIEVLTGGEPASTDTHDMVDRVAWELFGGERSFRVEIDSPIPQARGLGSSAAIITGVAAAMRFLTGGSYRPADLLRAAAAAEGHPDNVAAALFGGLVMVSPRGVVRRLEMASGLRLVVAVPDAELPTGRARQATADPVPTPVAVRTAARLGFLIEGLRTGDPELLAEAGGDELHEARRAHLAPGTIDLMESAGAAGAMHTAWSGAGPSVVAFTDAGRVTAVADAMRTVLGDGGSVLDLSVAERGVEVG